MSGVTTRGRWATAVAGGALVLLLVVPLFRAPRAPAPMAPRVKPSVKLDPSPASRDEARFFDPTPLFLPTKNINAAPPDVKWRELGAAFPDYPSKPSFAAAELRLDSLALPKPVVVPARPAEKPGEVLALAAPGALALGFGRTEAPVAPLTARGAHVEIIAAASGRSMLSRDLATARPPGDGTWQPVEFLAAVDAAGLVGSLVLTTRSGVEDVDSYFQNYLVRTLRVGERLAPGFYRICVGP
jgi:hypothetical protein